jgi:hypothetical protein
MHRVIECVAANFFAYFKNRLRRARRDALDTIKQMKLPEDDDKREKEVVEKTLAQVCVCVTSCLLLSHSMCFCNICLSCFCAALEGGGDWFAMFFAGIHESTRAFNFFSQSSSRSRQR